MELNNLQQEAYKLRMTPEEKSAMKAHIFGVPAASPTPSPYFIFSFQFLQTRVLAPAMVLLVVFVGAGTAAAAQGALPGDILYPVKVSINETVEIALATTPVARAEVSAKLAERRVEEAEALAAQGALTPQTGQALAANFEAHANDAHELANEVEAKDPATAAQLRTKLDSSLVAHGAILATLSGGTAANQEGAGAVAASVIARADTDAPANTRMAKSAPMQNQTMMLVVATETSDATGTQETVSLENDMVEEWPEDEAQEQAAAKLGARAEDTLERAHERFEDGKEKLASAAITQVSGEFVEIDKLMEQGSTTLSRNEYEEASNYFTEAYKKAIKLDVLLKAQAKIERNIISPILEQHLIIDDLNRGTLEASVIRSLPAF